MPRKKKLKLNQKEIDRKKIEKDTEEFLKHHEIEKIPKGVSGLPTGPGSGRKKMLLKVNPSRGPTKPKQEREEEIDNAKRKWNFHAEGVEEEKEPEDQEED